MEFNKNGFRPLFIASYLRRHAIKHASIVDPVLPFTLSYYNARFEKSRGLKPVPLSHRGIILSHPRRFLMETCFLTRQYQVFN